MDSTQHKNASTEATPAVTAVADEAAGAAAGVSRVAAPRVEPRTEIERTGASSKPEGSSANRWLEEADASARLEESSASARLEESSASARLAQRRAELGMSLEDVAGQLKFAVRQIEALEAGNFDKLPAGTFARGMVRGYARLLKADPEPLLAELAASVVVPQVAAEDAVSMRTPIPFSDGGRRVNLVYAVLSLLILVAVAYLASEWYLEGEGAGRRGVVPAANTMLAPRPAAGPDGPSLPAPQPPIVTRAPAVPVADDVLRPANVTAGARRRIVLKFGRESWVEVKAANGETLMSQLNRPGSERSVEGEPPLSLVIGNASSVQLFYNERRVDLKPYLNDDVARLILD